MKPSVADSIPNIPGILCVGGASRANTAWILGKDSIKMPFFVCALPPAVQEDAEPGAHTPVRDEPLWQSGVRVHFQHFPG